MGTIDPQAIKPDGVFTTTCWECSAYCGALARATSIVPSQCFDMQFSVSIATYARRNGPPSACPFKAETDDETAQHLPPIVS